MVKDHSDSKRGEETCCCHMGYSFRLAARVLLYAPSHRQDSTYRSLCYTSRGALAGTRKSSMGPPWRIDPTTQRTMSEHSYHGATSRSLYIGHPARNNTGYESYGAERHFTCYVLKLFVKMSLS